jgi:hypothetical protein
MLNLNPSGYNKQPKLRVSDLGVISVDSNELARSKAGRKQIEALKRMTKR